MASMARLSDFRGRGTVGIWLFPIVGEVRSNLNRPRVLLADDHGLVLERVASLLMPYCEVVGTVNNGRDLLAEAQRLQPDVIILDITMPMVTGIEVAHELRESACTSKLIFLTVHQEVEMVRAAFAEGALGYVSKSRLKKDLLNAIDEVLSGHRFISRSLPM